jgi:hypothetical protein
LRRSAHIGFIYYLPVLQRAHGAHDRSTESAEMDSSRRIKLATVLAAIAASLITQPLIEASAAAPEKKIELTGKVIAIFPVHAKPPSMRNWAVKVRVKKVKAGEYSKPEFTFTIHSPALTGLAVGGCCAIEATWTEQGYVVNKTRSMKRKDARR